MTESKLLWTKQDVCKELGISAPTLNRLLATGKIKTVKINRMVRIKETDVMNYIETNYK